MKERHEASRLVTLPLVFSAFALAWAGVAIYILRPLELGMGLARGWNEMLPIDNLLRIMGFWLVVTLIIAIGSTYACITAHRRGYGIFGVLAISLGAFALIATTSLLPAFQMHNQLESHIPQAVRPDIAGPVLSVLFLAAMFAAFAGIGLAIVQALRRPLSSEEATRGSGRPSPH